MDKWSSLVCLVRSVLLVGVDAFAESFLQAFDFILDILQRGIELRADKAEVLFEDSTEVIKLIVCHGDWIDKVKPTPSPLGLRLGMDEGEGVSAWKLETRKTPVSEWVL